MTTPSEELTTPPWVVGTTRPDGLSGLAARASSAPPAEGGDGLPDLIEVRLDLAGADGRDDAASEPATASEFSALLSTMLEPCRRLEAAGVPLLVTMRLAADGGRWRRDAERGSFFEQALGVASWIDVEVESAIARDVVELAHAGGRRVIVSHHDLRGTPAPADLARIVRRSLELGADIVKLATLVNSWADHAGLVQLVHASRAAGQPVAVIGMGSLGTPLRSYLPTIGSRLTYGFLDQSAAPGQIPASALVARLRSDCPPYDRLRSLRG